MIGTGTGLAYLTDNDVLVVPIGCMRDETSLRKMRGLQQNEKLLQSLHKCMNAATLLYNICNLN